MGQKLSAIVNSFNGGELSRRLEGRTDTSIYAIGAAEMLNFVATVEGPAVKRPGTRMKRLAAASASWLIPFVFNQTQAYQIEASGGIFRFYTNGGRIETGPTAPYEVAVPYAADEMPDLSIQQSYDRIYIAHENHAPATLNRTAATTFAHSALALKNGPFNDTNDDDAKTLTASGTTGSVTITANAPIFAPGHVGALFRMEAKDFSDIKVWEAGLKDAAIVGQYRRYDGRVYQATADSSDHRTGSSPPTHDEGSEWDGDGSGKDINDKGPFGVLWAYVHDRFGIARITAVAGDGLSATATVLRTLPTSLTTVASRRWAHGCFSDAEGWPSHVIIAKGRLIFFKDFECIASVSGDYLNFQQFLSAGFTAPDLAFRRPLSIRDRVLWVAVDTRILVGTASGEYAIGPVNTAEAFSGSNFDIVRQSKYGCARCQPVEAGVETIFVQAGGRKVRGAQFDLTRDRYVAPNKTVWHRHITRGGVIQLAFQQNPEELVWGVRADGVLIAHPHEPEQEVKGWSRVALAADGRVLSAISTPSPDGSIDELWLLVERDGVKTVECMAEWWEEGMVHADAFFVDSGLSYEGPAISHFTGADHLAGRAVQVLAAGAVVDGITVGPDGSFDLPYAASPVQMGIGYSARITTMRLDGATREGTLQGKRKRLINATLRLIDAGIGIVAGSFGGKLDALIRRPSNLPMGTPVELFNGDTDNISIGGGWDKAGQLTIESNNPQPCIVTALMPDYALGD